MIGYDAGMKIDKAQLETELQAMLVQKCRVEGAVACLQSLIEFEAKPEPPAPPAEVRPDAPPKE